ncbi:BZ3501_MvSof-1269-A2-R1_C32g00111 [Microbotryum saponariae]|nr:BZ3501_MvSof-1269-A2-R1_C32g00111 [Microbotryum saponariae]
MSRTIRSASISRKTNETDIAITLTLDVAVGAAQEINISNRHRILDHMYHALAKHSKMSLTIKCKGDLWIDDHHTAEDSALALGEAFKLALGERKGIRSTVQSHPLDEAVLDISSRPYFCGTFNSSGKRSGPVMRDDPARLSVRLPKVQVTLHVDVIRGERSPQSESAFKALALAIRKRFKPMAPTMSLDQGRFGALKIHPVFTPHINILYW